MNPEPVKRHKISFSARTTVVYEEHLTEDEILKMIEKWSKSAECDGTFYDFLTFMEDRILQDSWGAWEVEDHDSAIVMANVEDTIEEELFNALYEPLTPPSLIDPNQGNLFNV